MKRVPTRALRDLKDTKGFTLIELMLGIALAAVIIGIAAPNMRTFILNNRISSAANELLRSVQTARSEASKRQKNVVICMTSSLTSPACSTSSYVGWIVFEDSGTVNWDYDTGEPLLESHTFQSTIKILADNGKRVSYAGNGFRTTNGGSTAQTNSTGFVVCDSRGIKDVSGGTTGLSLARGIYVSPTGRSRITREVTNTTSGQGITQLYNNTGGSC